MVISLKAMNTTNARPSDRIRRLTRPGGRVAFTVQGGGPLVVCAPGIGDLRGTFDRLADALVAAGYRVALTDLRGHGDSDTTFSEQGDVATAEDLLALVDHLGGPAVLVGSSMGAAASLWAAAERPEAVAGVVLLGPFVRDADLPAWRARLQRTAIRLALLRPWGPAAWSAAYRSFAVGSDHRRRAERDGERIRGRLPGDFDSHVADVRASLRDPGRLRSLRDLVRRLRHDVVDARLDEVRAPALVLMGAQDPDYPAPADELAYIERRLAGGTSEASVTGPEDRPNNGRIDSGSRVRAELLPECGHYPHLQRMDLVAPMTLEFLADLRTAGLLPASASGSGGTDA